MSEQGRVVFQFPYLDPQRQNEMGWGWEKRLIGVCIQIILNN